MKKSKNIILCVDDEKFILSNVKLQLKHKYGTTYHYLTADSAIEALEILDELMEEPGSNVLIISDWLMPVMKGDEFLIRVHERYPSIVTILLTGHADLDAVERCKTNANLHQCIFKPWQALELTQSIDSGFKSMGLA